MLCGVRHGQGKMLSKDKKRVIYDGQWKQDKPHGFGVKIFPNGDQHHGYYQDGIRHGWGMYTFICGDKYVG